MAFFSEEKQGKISANATLVKTMQEKNHKRGNVFAKKIGAIISNACGSRRKAQQMCIYNSKKPKECMEQKGTPISQENHELVLTKSHSCGENRVSKIRASGSRRKGSGRKSKKQSCKTTKRRLIVSSGISGILKSTGFSLRKWKAIKRGFANGSKGSGTKPFYGKIKRAKLRLKIEVRQGEKTNRHEEKECEAVEDNGELELCKKRILMGERCRPLNISGALHYDKEGILLPEDFLPSEEP
ncbi:hypothetical protein CDL12_18591 [Handroanthus impetiginosus]|uniref:Uncharacterized protein n=1 Tax=Handroanthus impetiginosus TaxID=429701 RepID=A0A2G9GU63_9LAMI|nr:hypothetical protein CDL12_18591 [Handroanthus impetiginosus]